MRKEVPKGKNPLEYLEEMGAQLENAWIFLHHSCIEEIEKNKVKISSSYQGIFETYTYISSEMTLEVSFLFSKEWATVCSIDSKSITYKKETETPGKLVYLKMG